MQSQIETVSEQRRDENIKAYFHEVFTLILCGYDHSLYTYAAINTDVNQNVKAPVHVRLSLKYREIADPSVANLTCLIDL